LNLTLVEPFFLSTRLAGAPSDCWDSIDFVHAPAKAFSMPFALDEGDFLRRGLQVNGLFLD